MPAFLQRLTDLLLSEVLLFRPIFGHTGGFTVLGDELRRLHVVGLPIEIVNRFLRSQKILGMPMTFQAPCHAMRLSNRDGGHVIHVGVATEATDAPIHMGAVIIKNVIDRTMEPDPVDWFTGLPALPHRLELRIIFLNLRMTIHAGLRVRHVRMRRHLDKTVTITAIHPQLRHVNVVGKRNWLHRLIANLRVFRRHIIPRRRAQPAGDDDTGDRHLQRQPVRPTWKEIRHKSADVPSRPTQPPT